MRRAEIFFDPQMHVSRGVPLSEVIGGLSTAAGQSRGQRRSRVALIACFLRDRGPADAARTLELLAAHAGQVLGVGLDSAEVGYPPGDFAAVFDAARGLGLHTVAHAGEEGPPEYVWQALDLLGVERVDHGIRSVEDRALLRRLAADAIPLTVCPLSNVRLRCVPALAEHPLPRLLDAGVRSRSTPTTRPTSAVTWPTTTWPWPAPSAWTCRRSPPWPATRSPPASASRPHSSAITLSVRSVNICHESPVRYGTESSLTITFCL